MLETSAKQLFLSWLVLSLSATVLVAMPITVVNPSFEADTLSDGGISNSIIGWQTTSGGGDGVFNPSAAQYPDGIPDGVNVAYVNLPGNFVSQTVTDVLEAGRIYTLRVQVGRKVGESFAGYRVQLRTAGDTILAEDDSTQTPAAGEFVPVTVTYRAEAGDPELGEQLKIYLTAPGVQANFDDVHLDVSRACLERPEEMIGWWPLDEPGPSRAADIINANDGTHMNGPTPIAGMVDGALSFDGTDDYVEVADDPVLDMGTSDFSVDFWLRTTDSVGVATVIDKRTNVSGDVRGYSLFLANGDLGFQLADGGTSADCSSNPATSSCTNYVSAAFLADDAWHHVAVTVSRADSMGLRFYVDGQEVASFDPTIRPDSLDNSAPLRFSGVTFSQSLHFAGDLDEIELFRRTLTPQEIADLHAVGAEGKCKEFISMDWDVPVCRDADVSRPTSIEICNGSPLDRDYDLTFEPVPAGACSVDGPDTFFLLDPVQTVPPAIALSIPARECREIPFEVQRPSGLNANRLQACFDAVLTNTSTGEEIRERSSIQDWRECCTTGPFRPVTEVPPGGQADAVFSLINTNGAPLSFDYRIEAMPANGGIEDSRLLLNGQTAGTPATGTVSFGDGEVVDVSVGVSVGSEGSLLPEDLILLVDTGDGVFSALASTRVRARPATDLFKNGFESGDTSAWATTTGGPAPSTGLAADDR